MKSKLYFPGLNGIRFIAAMSVILYHIKNASLSLYGIHSDTEVLSRFWLDGIDAVHLFFVLSGFLITYLLLVELQETGKVQVQKFYLRRVFRIWPLYYFLIFIGFVVVPLLEKAVGMPGALYDLPITKILPKFLMYITFLPNIGYMSGQLVVSIVPLWSIGVEEQFYLIWPLIAKHLHRRLLHVLIGIILVKLGFVVASLVLPTTNTPKFITDMLAVINLTSIENMALGGVGAYVLFHKKERLLRIIYHPIVEKAAWGIIIASMFIDITINGHWFGQLIMPLFFLIMIINICSNPRSTFKLENPLFNALGKISYGLYMYHVVLIYAFSLIVQYTPFGKSLGLSTILPLYIFIPLLTIAVAYLSYHYLEQPFLNWKHRFTVVASGSTAPTTLHEGKPSLVKPVLLPVVEPSPIAPN